MIYFSFVEPILLGHRGFAVGSHKSVFIHKRAKQDGILCTNIFHVNRYLRNMLWIFFCIDYPFIGIFKGILKIVNVFIDKFQ